MKTAFYSRRAPKASRRRSCLKVAPSLSRELIKFADLLEVRPSEFLHWQLSDWIQGLNNPNNGMLAEWARDGVEYDTPEQTERVQRRVDAWLAQRSAVLDAKEAKGGAR